MKIEKWFSESIKTGNLTHLEAHVLGIIFVNFNFKTKTACLPISSITDSVRADKRNTRRAIGRLVSLGVIAVERGGGARKTNVYRMALS